MTAEDLIATRYEAGIGDCRFASSLVTTVALRQWLPTCVGTHCTAEEEQRGRSFEKGICKCRVFSEVIRDFFRLIAKLPKRLYNRAMLSKIRTPEQTLLIGK